MHGDDNKHNIKEKWNAREKGKCKRNKMHEHNTKEMQCKRKIK